MGGASSHTDPTVRCSLEESPHDPAAPARQPLHMIGRRLRAEIVVLASLFGGLILLCGVSLTTYWSTSRLQEALDDLTTAEEARRSIDRFEAYFQEAQSNRRAFLISGDSMFLSMHHSARARVRLQVDTMHRHFAEAEYRPHLERIAAIGSELESVADEMIRERATGGIEAAVAAVRSREGQRRMEDIQRETARIKQLSEARLAAIRARASGRGSVAERIAVTSAVLALLLVPIAAFVVYRDLRYRRRQTEKLREAQTVAEAATRAKSEFLAGMSHEIRTPLNGVIGMTDLALDTELTRAQREYLVTARSSAEALLRLLNDILDFSKIEAGRMDLEHLPFALRDTVADTLRPLAHRAEEKRLNLAYRVAPGLPEHVVGDPGRFRQVVVNLVGNAVKFTDRGEIVVEVEGTPAGGSIELHVSVRDTGIGIAPERLRSIFELFTQEDSSTTRRFGGTGLGLTISEQLVKLMGGRIWVESTVGEGSTFHFTLRLDVADAQVAGRSAIEVEQLESLSVLVVDDHPTNRTIMAELLRGWRMQPVVVANAQEALHAAEERRSAGAPFRVAILDGSLPDMDGYALAAALVERQLVTGRSIIMLVSDTARGDAARRAELRIGSALTKPAKHSAILDAIMNALDGAASTTADAQPAESGVPAVPPGHRVLIVEDNAVNQRVAREFLERMGIDVVIASNGREALAVLGIEDGVAAPARFSAILMDVEMPEMDGLEATRRIRAAEQGTDRHVPILAVTAHALQEDLARCTDAGMDVCLTKPIRRAALTAAVAQLLPPEPPHSGSPDADDIAPPADLARLRRIAGDDEELMRELAIIFIDSYPSQVEAIRRGIAIGDIAAVQLAAHSLKGAAATLTASRLAGEAGELERIARAGDVAGAEAQLPLLEQELAVFRDWLSRFTTTQNA